MAGAREARSTLSPTGRACDNCGMEPRGAGGRLQSLLTLRRADENEARRLYGEVRQALAQVERAAREAGERVERCRLAVEEAEARGRALAEVGGPAGRRALIGSLVRGHEASLEDAHARLAAVERDRAAALVRVEEARQRLEQAIHAREGVASEWARLRAVESRTRQRREQRVLDDLPRKKR